MRACKSDLTNAQNKMQGWKSSLDGYKNWLQKKSDEAEESKKKMQTDCKKNCGKGNRFRPRSNKSCSQIMNSLLPFPQTLHHPSCLFPSLDWPSSCLAHDCSNAAFSLAPIDTAPTRILVCCLCLIKSLSPRSLQHPFFT